MCASGPVTRVVQPRLAAGSIALRFPAARKPGVSIHGHPLRGARHASLKDTASPMYPGGSRDTRFILRVALARWKTS